MTYAVVGSVPRGDDFFNREELVEKIWVRLEKDNILLVAPRRYGKTGVMYKILDNPQNSYHVIYIDVEHIMSASDFMVDLIATLIKDKKLIKLFDSIKKDLKGIGKFLKNLPKTIGLGEVKIELREQLDLEKYWKSYGDKIISLLNQENPKILLIIDEFPIMIDNIAKNNPNDVPELLRWFRSLRIGPNIKTRFIVGGSINLETTLNELGYVDSINDFSKISVKPFTSEVAQKYIESVFSTQGIKISEKQTKRILELVGAPIPYLVAVLVTAILDRQRYTKETIDNEMIDKAFNEDLLGGATSAVFNHYRTRIDSFYHNEEAKAARTLLGLLSKSDNFISQETLYAKYLDVTNLKATDKTLDKFMSLMFKLENDFYVARNNNGFAFFSRVLRLWWQTYYGFQSE